MNRTGALALLLAIAIARGLLIGALAWMSYVAIEPDLRRRSPHMLISWSRVLTGRTNDPLVWRDVLVGIAAGVGMSLLTQVVYIAPVWFGGAPDTALPFTGGPPMSVVQLLATLLQSPATAVLIAT